MPKISEHRVSNFWVGFSLGIGGAVGLAYLFGTKMGRNTVKKVLRFSENLEENLEHFIDGIDKHGSKKDSKKSLFRLDNIEGILTKIKQVTNQ
ncbi:MAG: hypothetical protein AAB929_02825 [Patescibacteria group bacterium]